MKGIKVLIVDDSALIRQVYRKLLEADTGIEVIGTASDPYMAVQKIQKERPDVITLDIEMPRMDGLTFLKKLMHQAPIPVVVISNQTRQGADVAMRALEIGAVDVMAKPNLANEEQIMESGIELIDKIRCAYMSKHQRRGLSDATTVIRTHGRGVSSGTVIAIGASTGGTEALTQILRDLPALMPPIVIVQHMPPKFTESFAGRLNQCCVLKVKEAQDNDVLQQGNVYIAPGGRHMAIRSNGLKSMISVFDSDLVNRHRPSVNVLFNSVAEVKGKHAIGVILTGMGDDGATGMLAMNQRGAHTIAQDETTSVVFGMPQKAISAGGVSEVLPLDMISKAICDKVFS
jgi:two-component system, chemotaxis family, protein-glutamate methylesterase/glutaminase